jgi:hypothetical protein
MSRRSGPGRLVNDTDGDTLFRQPEGKDQPDWACADDQYARIRHSSRSSISGAARFFQ